MATRIIHFGILNGTHNFFDIIAYMKIKCQFISFTYLYINTHRNQCWNYEAEYWH